MKNSHKIVVSDDGSNTLISSQFKESYHSTFGAVQESDHIFIQAALNPVALKLAEINLFEVGFGTGLNALLALKFAMDHHVHINYHAVEAYPIDRETAGKLNYPDVVNIDKELFLKMHESEKQEKEITPFFKLSVVHDTLQRLTLPEDYYHVVFFDAFSPQTQPEMWQPSCFKKIYNCMKTGGMLSTYSSKGIVKRALKSVGFQIEKLPGPPGKREFVRAIK